MTKTQQARYEQLFRPQGPSIRVQGVFQGGAVTEPKIKPSYQTLDEIGTRLNCGHLRVKALIKEGLPAKNIAGQYMMSEKLYMEWLEKWIKK